VYYCIISYFNFKDEEPMDIGEWDRRGFAQEDVPSNTDPYLDPMGSLRRKFYNQNILASQQKTGGFRKPGTWQKMKTRPVNARRKGDGNVKLIRSYRMGELPDILIKHSELLQSITSLAKVLFTTTIRHPFHSVTIFHFPYLNIDKVLNYNLFLFQFKVDDQFAKVFLVLLSIGIVEEMQQQPFFIDDVRNTFQNMLRNQQDKRLSRYLVSTILDVSTKCKISIQPSLVSDASINAKLTTSGILKLEQELGSYGAQIHPAPAKRARFADAGIQEESEADIWLRIVQLYREIEELDSVRSIYSHLPGTDEDYYESAMEALYYENVGNYLEAEQRYEYLYNTEVKKKQKNSLKLQLWNDGLQRVRDALIPIESEIRFD